MRILYVAWDDDAWRGTLFEGLRKAGHNIIPAYFRDSSNKYVFTIRSLLSAFANKSHVALCDYVSDMGYWGTRIMKPFQKPVVVYARGGDVDTNDPNFYREINVSRVKYALKKADVIMCVSRYVLNEVLKLSPHSKHKTRLVYNGVDTKRFRPTKHSLSYRLLAVGNLIPRKGFDIIIRSLPRILKKYPETELHIVGNGDFAYKKRLLVLATKLHVDRSITFMGHVSDQELPRIYARSDLFIHTPRNEPFGVVLIEAMASGLPVIATSTGGIPEIVPEKHLISVDHPKGLAKKVVECLSLGDEERWQIGEQNRLIVEERFALEHQVNGVIGAMEEAVRKT